MGVQHYKKNLQPEAGYIIYTKKMYILMYLIKTVSQSDIGLIISIKALRFKTSKGFV